MSKAVTFGCNRAEERRRLRTCCAITASIWLVEGQRPRRERRAPRRSAAAKTKRSAPPNIALEAPDARRRAAHPRSAQQRPTRSPRYALARAIGLPAARLLHGLREYRGEPHRVELIASIDGIDYVDDSKGTNVGATVAALDGLAQRVVLIAGGDGKGGTSSRSLAPVDALVPRGDADWPRRAAIRAALEDTGIAMMTDHATLEEATRAAAHSRNRATPCCCRRLARASTCSRATRIARRCSQHGGRNRGRTGMMI